MSHDDDREVLTTITPTIRQRSAVGPKLFPAALRLDVIGGLPEVHRIPVSCVTYDSETGIADWLRARR